MLSQLTIRNFAIVESLDLELAAGMTVISGETGAGKSIMLDALGLALGDRAENGVVRSGAGRAEIVASFNISNLPAAADWLLSQDLDQDGDCILRRVITAEGRSRSYINGQPCPVAAIRTLADHLVDIHGQHEHQRLLKRDYHRALLDEHAGQSGKALKVRETFMRWRRLDQELKTLTEHSDEQAARIQLLSYQTEELDQLGLQDGELETLDEEQKTLANAGDILQTGHQLLNLTADAEQENCLSLLSHCEQLLQSLDVNVPALQQAADMLSTAQIQIEEASQEIRHYLDRIEVNPQRQQEVEERLSSIYDLARKHRIKPEELVAFHTRLRQELDSLSRSDEELDLLTQTVAAARESYKQAASSLSRARQKSARQLGKAVDVQLHELGMGEARFEVCLSPLAEERQGPHGLEEVEFLISANRGQPARPLAKVASGGELSRISLAIQVITAQTSATPTLIFDEVDVGIGGAIAEVVGRMLRQLGERAQILCVTHQPQVASQGHQHLFVSKMAGDVHTHTRIRSLDSGDRVQEVARMLGGIDITERSVAHAREMLGLG